MEDENHYEVRYEIRYSTNRKFKVSSIYVFQTEASGFADALEKFIAHMNSKEPKFDEKGGVIQFSENNIVSVTRLP